MVTTCLEPRMKDRQQMFGHHVLTTLLLSLSYYL